MMEERVRVQCSTNDDAKLMFFRVREAEERWPDQEFDCRRGEQLISDMQYASDCFDLIEITFPTHGEVRGNDYVDVRGHILKRALQDA